MTEEIVLKLHALAQKVGSSDPLVLLQALGFDLIFSDMLPDWMDIWVDDSIAPAGFVGVMFISAALRAKPVIYNVAARELVKVLAGSYNDPSFFCNNDNHKKIDRMATDVAKTFVDSIDPKDLDEKAFLSLSRGIVQQPIL